MIESNDFDGDPSGPGSFPNFEQLLRESLWRDVNFQMPDSFLRFLQFLKSNTRSLSRHLIDLWISTNLIQSLSNNFSRLVHPEKSGVSDRQ